MDHFLISVRLKSKKKRWINPGEVGWAKLKVGKNWVEKEMLQSVCALNSGSKYSSRRIFVIYICEKM